MQRKAKGNIERRKSRKNKGEIEKGNMCRLYEECVLLMDTRMSRYFLQGASKSIFKVHIVMKRGAAKIMEVKRDGKCVILC